MARRRRDSAASMRSAMSVRTVYSNFSLAASVFAATAPRTTAAPASVQVDATHAHAPTSRSRTQSTAPSSGAAAAATNPTLIRALHDCYVAGRYRQLSHTMGLGLSNAECLDNDGPGSTMGTAAPSSRAPGARRRTPSTASVSSAQVDLELRLKTVTDVRRLEWEIQAMSTSTPLARVLPLLDRAAELGSLPSMYRLALLYAYGVARYHPPPKVVVLQRDPRKAIHWTVRALHAAIDAASSPPAPSTTALDIAPPDPIATVLALTSILARIVRTSAVGWPAIESLRLHASPTTTGHSSYEQGPGHDSIESSAFSFSGSPESSVRPLSNPSVAFPPLSRGTGTTKVQSEEEMLAAASALWEWLAPLTDRLETYLESLVPMTTSADLASAHPPKSSSSVASLDDDDDIDDVPAGSSSATQAKLPSTQQANTSLQQARFISSLVRLREWLSDLVPTATGDEPHEPELDDAQLDQDHINSLLDTLAVPPASRSASATVPTLATTSAVSAGEAEDTDNQDQRHLRDLRAAVKAVLDAGQAFAFSRSVSNPDTIKRDSAIRNTSFAVSSPEQAPTKKTQVHALSLAVQRVRHVLAASLEEEHDDHPEPSDVGPRQGASPPSPTLSLNAPMYTRQRVVSTPGNVKRPMLVPSKSSGAPPSLRSHRAELSTGLTFGPGMGPGKSTSTLATVSGVTTDSPAAATLATPLTFPSRADPAISQARTTSSARLNPRRPTSLLLSEPARAPSVTTGTSQPNTATNSLRSHLSLSTTSSSPDPAHGADSPSAGSSSTAAEALAHVARPRERTLSSGKASNVSGSSARAALSHLVASDSSSTPAYITNRRSSWLFSPSNTVQSVQEEPDTDQVPHVQPRFPFTLSTSSGAPVGRLRTLSSKAPPVSPLYTLDPGTTEQEHQLPRATLAPRRVRTPSSVSITSTSASAAIRSGDRSTRTVLDLLRRPAGLVPSASQPTLALSSWLPSGAEQFRLDQSEEQPASSMPDQNTNKATTATEAEKHQENVGLEKDDAPTANGLSRAASPAPSSSNGLHHSLAAPEDASILRTDQTCATCGGGVRNGALDRQGRVFCRRECRLTAKTAQAQ